MVIPRGSKWMKSTKTLDLMFLKALLILEMWRLLFFINFKILSPFIGTITCFLDGLLVVIWIWGLGFALPLMIFWTWSILLALKDEKISLILMTSSVWLTGFETWAYDLVRDLLTGADFKFLKNLEISLTSLGNLAGIGGGSFLMLTETVLFLLALFLLMMGFTLRVNFNLTDRLKKWDSIQPHQHFSNLPYHWISSDQFVCCHYTWLYDWVNLWYFWYQRRDAWLSHEVKWDGNFHSITQIS